MNIHLELPGLVEGRVEEREETLREWRVSEREEAESCADITWCVISGRAWAISLPILARTP